MSNSITWVSGVSPDREESRQTIASWWTGLGGKRVKWCHILGIKTDASTGMEEEVVNEEPQPFIINNPRLESNTLSFEQGGQRREIRFKRLELQGNQLKVFDINDPHRYVFTESSGGGSFRSEKFF